MEDLQRSGELVQRKLLRLWDNILNKALANEFLSKLRWISKVKYKLMYTRKIKTVHALEPADFSCRALFYFVKCYRPKLIGIRTSEGFRKFSELKQWWSCLVKTHLDFSDSHFDWFFLQCVAVAMVTRQRFRSHCQPAQTKKLIHLTQHTNILWQMSLVVIIQIFGLSLRGK